MKFMRVGLLFSIVCLLAACSTKNDSSNPRFQLLYTKGNPLAFVEKDQMRTQVFTPENFSDFHRYLLFEHLVFSEKDLQPQESPGHRNLEKENAPAQGDLTEGQNTRVKAILIEENADGSWWMNSHLFRIEFQEDRGYLKPVSLENEYERTPVTPLHISVSADERSFSMLLHGYYPGARALGKVLISLVYGKDSKSGNVAKGSQKYNYMFGPGVKIRWQDSPVTLLACHFSDDEWDSLQNGLNVWSDAIRGRLQVDIRTSESCPPFSDLNTQTIRVVDDYLIEYNNEIRALGFTRAIPDYTRSGFFDADILLFSRELGKAAIELKKRPTVNKGEYMTHQETYTMSHEFGHFLGLHHIFDGTHSIMSYSFDGLEVTDYDREAIGELYPLRTDQPEEALGFRFIDDSK